MSKIHELAFNAEEIDELLDSVDKKTIYQDATQSEHGLMSTTDKTKLDALPTEQQIDSALNEKVDKEDGKGLSKNDYTDAEKESVASAYHKPQNGIPESDLDSSVQTSLNKADTALQSFTETDPTVPSWAKQSAKPSYDYSEIGNTPDLSGFITKSVNDLTNYYLKSETYTKAEVAALIGAIQQFHYEIYATLPSSGESNVLYLIGPIGSGSDKYEEYVYANNAFTKIGDTSIDLSGYVTTSALNTALADYTTTSNLTALLSNKADKVSNATSGNFAGLDANGNLNDSGKKASDFATASQGTKADTAYQKPSSGIPESDLSSDVQQALQKHFKGWYNTLAELKAAHTAVEGDSAYVKDASPATTWSIYIYDSTASSDNNWADSGTDADTSNVQTFASNQEVNEVHIVNDLITGGVDDVLSAEQGKVIGDTLYEHLEFQDDMSELQTMMYYPTVHKQIGDTFISQSSKSTQQSAYACIRLSCSGGEKFKLFGQGGNDYGHLWTFTDSNMIILSQQDENYYVSNGDILEAPNNAAYLYINFYHYDNTSNKVQRGTLQQGLETRVSIIEDKNIPDVVDNLESDSSIYALSARQGKILNDYSNGVAGVDIQDVPSHSTINNMLRGVVKRVWIEVPNDSIILPQELRLYLIRNRSEGDGNKFIMQFCDSSQFDGSNIIFNGSNPNKLTGENSVIINGRRSFVGVKIHIDLDFTGYTDDYNTLGNNSDFYLHTEDLNRRDTYTESVKEALLRVDTEVYNNLNVKYPLGNISGVGTMGASLMFDGNNWVEDGCRLCGVSSYNKAQSGVGIPSYFADLIWRGTYCTDEEFENMDILAIQFASSGDVYTGEFFDTFEEYTENFDLSDPSNQFSTTYTHAQCLDYILKYWQERCYADRNNPSSKWYGTQYGKPCRLLFVTHWHDARVDYNDSIRLVAAKWGGGICEFDKKIGFSKNQTINGLQPSIIFANETQSIGGVDYGWHPLRGVAGEYIQTKMANIFASSLMEYFSMN